MRAWLRFLLPFAILVSMAGAPQSATAEDEAFPSDPAKHPKVVALLKELTEHVKAGDRAAASKLFDVNTMVADLEAMGFFRMPPGKSPTELRGQLRIALAMGLRRRQAIPEYETQALRKVSRDTKDGRLIVYAVLDPGTLEAAPVRWYLVPDGDGWKIWDFESLDMGIRFIYPDPDGSFDKAQRVAAKARKDHKSIYGWLSTYFSI